MLNKKPLYQRLAIALKAKEDCDESGNMEWFHKWDNMIDNIIDNYMPHGSGIDAETTLLTQSENVIRFQSAFHTMTDGYYGRWIDYTVTIKPDFIHDIDLLIVGDFGQFQDIKEYLYELYYEALTRIVLIEA